MTEIDTLAKVVRDLHNVAARHLGTPRFTRRYWERGWIATTPTESVGNVIWRVVGS